MGIRRRRDDREIQRVLKQMERLDHRPVDLVGPGYGGVVGPRRRSSLPGLLVVLVLASLFGAWRFGLLAGLGDFAVPRAYVDVDGKALAVPFPPKNTERLLAEVPATTQGSYAFLYTGADGTPVGYDPCRPVRYVIRPDGMPQVGEQMITEAVAQVSAATGLKFEYAGITEEPPMEQRAVIQTDRYGDDWAPVVIAWTTADEVPELAGSVAGIGGSAKVPGADGSGDWLAAGRVYLDAQDVVRILAYHDGYAQARAVVMHELAHVVGLDHVADRSQLMYPEAAYLTDFGAGDLEGLALVGQVACERD